MSYVEFEGDPYPDPDPDRVELYLGVKGPESFAAHDADNSTQPAGAGFRDLVWTPPNLGKVRITSHYTNLDLDHVFLAMGVIFARINDGVNKISIDGSLHEAEYTDSLHAYDAYVSLMKQLQARGWKPYVLPWSERIAAEDNLKYALESVGEIVAPYQLLSYEQWVEIFDHTADQLGFEFYNHDLILSISINRRKMRSEDDPREQYMYRASFASMRYDGLNLIPGSSKMNAEELRTTYETNAERHKEMRADEEEKYRSMGYHINENYQDPDVWQYIKPRPNAMN